MMLGFIWADYWWFAIPGLILGVYAQMRLMSAYGKYSEVGSASGITGAQAAREILDNAGLHDVPVEEIGGQLTDHYDPAKRALFVSSDNYHGQSLAAIAQKHASPFLSREASAALERMNRRQAVAP